MKFSGNTSLFILFLNILLKNGEGATDNPELWNPEDETSKNRNLVVWFNPFVSIKDTVQGTVYTEATITPLLEKVGTRFSQIMVHITTEELLGGTAWNCVTSGALAKLNKLKETNAQNHTITFNETGTPTPYLQIWISFHYHKISSHNQSFVLSRITDMCARANSIFAGTIYALTIHFPDEDDNEHEKATIKFLHKNLNDLPASQQYKLGVMFEIAQCDIFFNVQLSSAFGLSNYIKWLVKYTDIIFFDAITKIGSYHFTSLNNIEESVHGIVSKSRKCHTVMKNIFASKALQMGMLTGLGDTNTNGNVNLTSLVSFWKSLAISGWELDVSFIIFSAFDYFEITSGLVSLLKETMGWWRLKENRNYKNATEYVFEEKLVLAQNISKDDEFQGINQTWLESSFQFRTSQSGVSLPWFISSSIGSDDRKVRKILLNQISSLFGNLMVKSNSVVHPDTGILDCRNENMIIQLANELNIEKDNQSALNTIVTLKNTIPGVNLTDIFLKSGQSCIEMVKEVGLLLTNLNTKEDWHHGLVLNSDLSNNNNKKSKIPNQGVLLPLGSWCHESSNLSSEISYLTDTIAVSATVNWFKLVGNVERYISQFIILLEECQKKVGLYVTSSQRLIFVIDWVEMNLGNNELFKLISVVRFWEGVSDWAGKKNNVTVILGEAFDSISETGEILKSDGWWTIITLNEESQARGNNFTSRFHFEDKKTAAWRIYMKEKQARNAKPSEAFLGNTEILGVVIISIFGVLILVNFIVWGGNRRYQFISKEEVDAFFNGKSDKIEIGEDNNEIEKSHTLGYDKARYEIKRGNFTTDESEGAILGNGEFGKVCKCKIFRDGGQTIHVAVKMPKISPNPGALLGILSEIKILSYVGKHQNIIELLGANTEQIHRGIVYVFLEFCHLGSLYKCLRQIKSDIGSRRESKGSTEDNKLGKYSLLEPSLSTDFFNWAVGIAKGMEFMASKNVVHADLATRNILLNLKREAKICDFGLSRRMYNNKCYVKAGEEALPWRWMAPESLRLSHFTEKSDVWSFGVLMWEMYSLGEVPYPGKCWDVNLASHLENGLRLPEPIYSEKKLYSLMLQCWHTNPASRPDFSDVVAILELCQLTEQ